MASTMGMPESVSATWGDSAAAVKRAAADGFLARLDLDDPEIQRLWCEYYMGPQDNFMREVAGITLEYFGPGLAF